MCWDLREWGTIKGPMSVLVEALMTGKTRQAETQGECDPTLSELIIFFTPRSSLTLSSHLVSLLVPSVSLTHLHTSSRLGVSRCVDVTLFEGDRKHPRHHGDQYL